MNKPAPTLADIKGDFYPPILPMVDTPPLTDEKIFSNEEMLPIEADFIPIMPVKKSYYTRKSLTGRASYRPTFWSGKLVLKFEWRTDFYDASLKRYCNEEVMAKGPVYHWKDATWEDAQVLQGFTIGHVAPQKRDAHGKFTKQT